MLTHRPESIARPARDFSAGFLLALLALALWLAALGFSGQDGISKASVGPAPAPSALVTLADATTQVGISAATHEFAVEPTDTRLVDQPAADMEGSDTERFPARSLLPQTYRGYGWLNSAALLADLGRVNALLRPPDA